MNDIEPIKWGESISEKTYDALRKLGWIDPNDIQDIKGEINKAKTFLRVNYGPEGKTIPNVVTENGSLDVMIFELCSHYEFILHENNIR